MTLLQKTLDIINNNTYYILKLKDNALLSEENIIKISNAIQNNNTIYSLIIDTNDYHFLNILFDVLIYNNTLCKLKIKNIILSTTETISLCNLLKTNKSILSLKLSIYSMTNIIADSIKYNENLINVQFNLYYLKYTTEILFNSLKNKLYIEKIILYNSDLTEESINILIELLNDLRFLKYIYIYKIKTNHINNILKSLQNK